MEYEGNSVLCTKTKAKEIVNSMQQRADEEICSLHFLYGCRIPLSAKIYAKQYPMGYGVKADLYYEEELLRHYTTPEELLLDLMGLSMKKMRENRRNL
jgi:hypothetical protein